MIYTRLRQEVSYRHCTPNIDRSWKRYTVNHPLRVRACKDNSRIWKERRGLPEVAVCRISS